VSDKRVALLSEANPIATIKPASLIAFAAVWLAMLLLGAGDVDRAILLDIYAGDQQWLASLARGVSRLGQWETLISVIAAAALWLIVRRQYWSALVLVLVPSIGRVLGSLQKVEVGRPRPHDTIALSHVESLSFPSGHAANSMMFYLTFALVLTQAGKERQWAVTAALLLSFLIGVSRVVLGVHWPSDVIAGWAFGLMWTLVWCHYAEHLDPSRLLLRK
jgi:undecaprenyl-diphosphatase